MHILLTDVLTCPNCGPEFGLILLADRVENRRVLEGTLGCANCRERYGIDEGFADLRPSEAHRGAAPDSKDPEKVERAEAAEAAGGADGADGAGGSGAAETAAAKGENEEGDAFRLAALMGVTEGPGLVLVVGPPAAHSAEISALVEDVEVIAAGPGMLERSEAEGVSRVALARSFPFEQGSMRAVVLGGGASDVLLEEGAGVLKTTGRLVLEDAPSNARRRLEEAGFEIAAEEGGVIVAVKRGSPDPPKLYQLG